MKGCLPTTGQSQWIISTDDHLDKALTGDTNELRCREHVKTLNIDFAEKTLVHYRFASGYCGRPAGLEFDAIKETSSNAVENRLLLIVGFDGPGDDYCKTWTTYPLWALVPKLPAGYGFGFQSEAR
jgi:hypothetical protein